jgi:YD repeat-containing protein
MRVAREVNSKECAWRNPAGELICLPRADGTTQVNLHGSYLTSVQLSFEYDAAGQMLTAADDVSSYEYTYNGLGQVTLIEIDNGGPLVELVQEFTPVGSRSLLAASFDDGGGMDDDFQNIFYYGGRKRGHSTLLTSGQSRFRDRSARQLHHVCV